MRSAAAALAIIVLAAAPAAAQGRQRPRARPVQDKSNPPPSASSTTAAPSAESVPVVGGVRQFGSWLDDASLVEPAHGYASISIGHYRSLGGRQTDFPIVDGAFGLTPRLQVGVSVPYYRLTFNDGTRISGLGDMYLSTKVSIVAPENTERRIGLALSPVLEVLGDPDPIKNTRDVLGLAGERRIAPRPLSRLWLRRLLFARRLVRKRRARSPGARTGDRLPVSSRTRAR